MRKVRRVSFRIVLAILLLLGLVVACSRGRDRRPNVIWIVWDTVRADHLGLYGYEKETTPFLDRFAEQARVFDDCVSVANYTVSAHGSMFTGLLPSEHGARNGYLHLDDKYETIAELLRSAGYQTYLYSANPHISEAENFAQGFGRVDHPWNPNLREEAIRIVQAKIVPEDKSSELPAKFRAARVGAWDIKASGELAGRSLLEWLRGIERSRPFFAFLNYMEAHRPYIPPASCRRRVMTEEEVSRSYGVDRSWTPLWSYTFGLHEYGADELAVMAGTYDATIAELDDLLRELVGALDDEGFLENTVFVLTSDHGEHLGGHHILGHQYSLYQPLLHVPLIVRYAERFPPGREKAPVMNFDLFPTILELAGARNPHPAGAAVSLLRPRADRIRLSESLGLFQDPFRAVQAAHPGWNPRPWRREIRAVFAGGRKLIRWSNGRREMYDLAADPGEARNLAPDEIVRVARMDALLDRRTNTFGTIPEEKGPPPELPEEQKELLRSLGYLTGDTPAGEAAEGESDRKEPAGGEESAGANRNGGGDQ